VDQASLRFLNVEGLDAFLDGVGFEVEARYGDWSRGPLPMVARPVYRRARDDDDVVARAAWYSVGLTYSFCDA
jgi:hypothetical protein